MTRSSTTSEKLIVGLFGLSVLSGLPLVDFGVFSITPVRAGLAVALAGLFISALQSNLKKVRSDFAVIVLYFLLVWLFYAFFATFFSLDYYASMRQIVALLMNFLIIVSILLMMRKRISFSALVTPIFLIGVCLAAFGIFELIFDWHLPQSRYHAESGFDGREIVTATATFYNQNDFATFLTVFLAFSLSIARHGHSRFFRYSAMLGAVCAFIVIAAILSRANIIASLVIGFLFLMTTSGRVRNASIIAVATAAVVWFSSLDNILSERLIEGYERFVFLLEAAAYESGSGGTRLNLARNGFYFLGETWLLGVGPGNFEAWVAARAVYPTGHITNAHSFWLELLVNYGVFIFSLFLFLYFFLIYHIYRIFRANSDNEKAFLYGLFLSLVGLVFAVQSSSSIFFSHWFWVILGLAIARVQLERENTRRYKFPQCQSGVLFVPSERKGF